MIQGITRPYWAVRAAAVAFIVTGVASAQQSEPTIEQPAAAQLEEIVVTAEKRATTVDKTPISISAVSGKDLQDRGITDFSTLAGETPGCFHEDRRSGTDRIRDARHVLQRR